MRAPAAAGRKRLAPAIREREILAAAADFFAEAGLSGHTRELAARLGITQPLLYRYFPSKGALIDRVYREVYMDRWDPAWGAALADRSSPLRDRLIALYRHYFRELLTDRWIRIYLYGVLEAGAFNRRHVEVVEERILRPICAELRAHFLAPEAAAEPASMEEIEAVRQWHAGIIFHGVRRFVHRMEVENDTERVIADAVEALLGGVGAILTPRRKTAP